MPSDSPSHSGRRHHFRGRRGHDRRGGDRRTAPGTQPGAGPEAPPRGDHVDVEQIMRDIRAKIAQRHGVELNDQQVQDLAARRLESILDPRTINPSLLEQLRRSAGARPESVAAADRATVPYEFEDTTLYDSPSGFTRFIRKLLNPILKLFFNPNPLIRAMHIQSRLNVEAAQRDAERDLRQAEWNALHYEILRRVVTETARVSLEAQSLAQQVESLSAKVDFNERRVRGVEGVLHQARPGGGREREREQREPAAAAPTPVVSPSEPGAPPSGATTAAAEVPTGEAPRRRRRRRRNRRGGAGVEAVAPVPSDAAAPVDALESDDADEGLEGLDTADLGVMDSAEDEANGGDVETAEGQPDAVGPGDIVTTGTDAIDQLEAAGIAAPAQETAPERVTPQLVTSEPAAREEAAPGIPAPAPDKAES